MIENKILVCVAKNISSEYKRSLVFVPKTSERFTDTLGFIINKHHPKYLAESIVDEIGTSEIDKIYFGGVSNPQRAFVVHSNDYANVYTDEIIRDKVCLTVGTEIIHDMCLNDGPSQHMVVVGHTEWAPGQLEEEIEAGIWKLIEPSPEFFYTTEDRAWEMAMRRIALEESTNLVRELFH